jgi:hypothetical protein
MAGGGVLLSDDEHIDMPACVEGTSKETIMADPFNSPDKKKRKNEWTYHRGESAYRSALFPGAAAGKAYSRYRSNRNVNAK